MYPEFTEDDVKRFDELKALYTAKKEALEKQLNVHPYGNDPKHEQIAEAIKNRNSILEAIEHHENANPEKDLSNLYGFLQSLDEKIIELKMDLNSNVPMDYAKLTDQLSAERHDYEYQVNEVIRNAYSREFAKVEDNPVAVLDDAKRIARMLLDDAYQRFEAQINHLEDGSGLIGGMLNGIQLRTKDDQYSWGIVPQWAEMWISDSMYLHFQFFENDPIGKDSIRKLIWDVISEDERVLKSGEGVSGSIYRKPDSAHSYIESVSDRRGLKPEHYYMTTEKPSSKVFDLYTSPSFFDENVSIGIERKSDRKKGKEINVLVNIAYDDLESGKNGIELYGTRFDSMDKAVMNAVISLYKSGNTTITVNDIRSIFTGGVYKETAKSNDSEFEKRLDKM
ncbi:MAG: hypothetical protein HUJ54_13995, partial [Erysipelotrichaceae bacterium]|nr:hypothetical protein [Erysipelotrichaceae bacterium]